MKLSFNDLRGQRIFLTNFGTHNVRYNDILIHRHLIKNLNNYEN